MVDFILFPSSFFSLRKVDEDLQQEYNVAVSTGLFDVALFDYDKWVSENKLEITGVPQEPRTAVYRGWMMKPEQYKGLYTSLLDKNIELVTTPDEYEFMHIFPNVYQYLCDDTAKMEIYPLHEQIDVEQLKESFQRFMIKDYVKSVKGTEFPTYFDQTITQQGFDHWMNVFYQYRGDLLTGGICVKEYLKLKRYDNKTNEYRVFYINNEPATISRNAGQGGIQLRQL